MKYSKYSTVIVGGGIAGLYAGLKISERTGPEDEILIIAKTSLDESNSRYAQGGIVAVLEENKTDDIKLHVKDTLKAGAGLSDIEVCQFISKNSSTVINDLIKIGVDFDKDEADKLKFTLEGAHSVNRILHCKGDSTGRYIEEVLKERVLADKKIKVVEKTLAVELLIDGAEKCRGLIAYNIALDEYEAVYASNIVLATGGLGQVYKYTTNPKVATGDGIALAYRAGAKIQDMEFVQFHPTSLTVDDKEDTRFLISEALRGEGGKLCDENKRRFMQKYDEKQELASRDIVTRAIFEEMKQNKTKNVYLDVTHIESGRLLKRFPNISSICKSNGIDITKDLIPVSPASHYTMGGIKTEVDGSTSIENLFAIGEVACTGLHGANRLASNSLLECVVLAYEMSKQISDNENNVSDMIDEEVLKTINKYSDNDEYYDINVESLKSKIRQVMWDYVGIERDEKSLLFAKSEIEKIEKLFAYTTKCPNIEEYELRNLIVNAKLIIDFAIKRKESRGAHYRTDYLNTATNPTHNYIEKGRIL